MPKCKRVEVRPVRWGIFSGEEKDGNSPAAQPEIRAVRFVHSGTGIARHADSERIARLPLNGRNALQLVGLTPGVVSIGKTGQMGMLQEPFRIAGGRPIDTNFKLDGGNNMNTYFATAVEYPNPDALQEFTVSQR